MSQMSQMNSMNHTYHPITKLYGFLPGDLRIRNDGTIWNFTNGVQGKQLVPKFNESGKPYLEFINPTGKKFLYWLQVEAYKLFIGPIPKGSEVYAIDNNKANFGVSNLGLKPKNVLEQTSYRITNETVPSNDKEKSLGVKPFNQSPPQDS